MWSVDHELQFYKEIEKRPDFERRCFALTQNLLIASALETSSKLSVATSSLIKTSKEYVVVYWTFPQWVVVGIRERPSDSWQTHCVYFEGDSRIVTSKPIPELSSDLDELFKIVRVNPIKMNCSIAAMDASGVFVTTSENSNQLRYGVYCLELQDPLGVDGSLKKILNKTAESLKSNIRL